jgi:hypothetical protein
VSRSFDDRSEMVDGKLLLLRLRSFTLDDILDEGLIPERPPET